MINHGNKDLQEITDCRSVPRKGLSQEAANNNTATYPCGAKVENTITSSNRRTRFCITCSLNTSLFHYPQQRVSYVLQLYKTTAGEPPASVVNAFNVTGVTITEDNGSGGRGNYNGQDDGDYYFDSDAEDIIDDDKEDDDREVKNAIRKVVFVIDDSVDPGMYRGRIYNNDVGAVSAIVKGMINVAAVAFDDIIGSDNSNNYIIDEIENETGMCTQK